MNVANYHRELQSILKRMDSVLLSPPPLHDDVSSSLSVVAMVPVIEARPSRIARLSLPPKQWRFTGSIPSVHQDQASRRDYVAGRTVLVTSQNDLSPTPGSLDLPSGMSLWHASDHVRRMLVLVRRDLDLLFSADLSGFPYDSVEEGLFALPGNHHLCYQDCMQLLAGRAPYVHKAMLEYAKMICCMYGCELRRFLATGRPRIQKLKRGVGMPLRLIQARQSRFDGGPVFLVSFGSAAIEHDFAPVLLSSDPPGPDDSQGGAASDQAAFRMSGTEGVLMVLDGSMRARYSHGVPRAQDGAGGGSHYVLSIQMDCLDTTCVMDYEPQTKTVVMYTPIRGSGVITTRAAPVSRIHSHISIQTDTTWRIVQAMRWRLQLAESRLIRKRYEDRINERADGTHRAAPG